MARHAAKKNQAGLSGESGARFWNPYVLALFLALLTTLLYSRVAGFEFVNYDDDQYVYQNAQVRAGLSWNGVAWAFTTTHAANWHPVTWLSHMLDVQVFGLRPGWHHCVNLMFHCMNAALLFWVLFRLTGAVWPSCFVAALFAVHPLHVESVAWIAERKDVLSTLFALLTLGAYIRYLKRPGLGRYILITVVFALGLMCKPMILSLPFLMLLLDWWPLRRLELFSGASFLHLVGEKTPLFLLSLASGLVTYFSQRSAQAILPLQDIPLGSRIANAFVSYLMYLAKMVWPSSLAVFYPHPWLAQGGSSVWLILLAIAAVGACSYVAFKQMLRRPYLSVGWSWYAGLLVPVLGLVQVGSQAMADRYTYVPLIGVFIAISWGGGELLSRRQAPGWLTTFLALLILGCLSVTTWFQIEHWRNSATLYGHALQVTQNNWIADLNLGSALEQQGQLEQSIACYRAAILADPSDPKGHSDLGNVLLKLNRTEEAIPPLEEALRLNPNYARAHINMGNALAAQGKSDEAIHHYREALRLDGKSSEAYNNLGNRLAETNQIEEAISCYRSALEIDPDNALTHLNLGMALAAGNPAEAIEQFHQALILDPSLAKAHEGLAKAYALQGDTIQALAHSQQAVNLEPKSAEILRTHGNLLAAQGDTVRAIAHYKAALTIDPKDASTQNNLGVILGKLGKSDDALACFRKALLLDPKYADAYCNLGLTLASEGKVKEGEASIRQALGISPGYPPALKALELIGKK